MNQELWETVIQPMLKDGKTNVQIASHLNLHSPRTDGGKYDPSYISQIALKNGVRRHKLKTAKKNKEVVIKIERKPELAVSPATMGDEILAIWASDIQETLKVKLTNLLTAAR